MARTETDQLVVSLEARITQFEKSFDRAQKSASRGYGQITSGSSRMASKIEQDFTRTGRAAARLGTEMGSFKSTLLGSFGAGFAGGAAAGFLAEIPSAIRNATKSIAEMKAEAARAGIAVAPFQELAFAAQQTKIPLDALTDGMKELQLRADEFVVTGKGPAAEAFERLGYGAEDLGKRLKDPVALFDDVIRRLKSFDRAAQIRILDEIFGGTGGERLVTLLDDGARSLEEMRGRARELGVVLSDDVVDKAAELDARFNEIAATIDANVKTGLIAAADVLASMIDYAVELDKNLQSIGNASFWTDIRRFMGYTDEDAARGNLQFQLMRRQNGQPMPGVPDYSDIRQSATGGGAPAELNITADRLSGLDDKLEAAVRQLVADAEAAGHAITVTSALRSTERQRQLWQEALAKYGSPAAARQYVAPPGTSKHEKGMAVDIAFPDRAAREWVAANMGAYGLAAPVKTETPLGTRHAHLELAGSRSAKEPRNEAAEAAKRQAETIAKVTQALDDERAVIGLTAEQTRLYNELRAAGVTLDSEQGQVIAEKVRLLYQQQAAQDALTAAQEKAKASAEEMAGLGRDAVGSFISDLREGVSAADALANALDRIADKLIDMALDQVFSPAAMGGLLGGLFGGGAGAPMNLLPKASGGPVRRGGAYLVGERRPELFVPNTNGAIIPNSRVMAPRGGGGDTSVQVNVINASGEKVETKERRTDLGRIIDVHVGKSLANGKYDKPMGSRYGNAPMKTRRA
jgi:hypothetical protein